MSSNLNFEGMESVLRHLFVSHPIHHNIVIRNRKILCKHRLYCTYFCLNLKYLGGCTENTLKQQKWWLL